MGASGGVIDYKFFIYDHIKPIIRKYVEDVHVNEMIDEREVNVDWDYFDSLGENCLILCAFKEKELIGFSAFQVTTNAMNIKEIEADNIMITVKKKFRGRVSVNLLNKANEYLKKIGVVRVNYLIENENLGKLLKRKGFKPKRVEWSVEWER